MSYLEIAGVMPGLAVSVDGVDPQTGQSSRTTIHCGYVALARSTGFRGAVRADDLQPISFFLPDAPPYATAPLAIGLELGIRRFRSTPSPDMVNVGPSGELAELVADPRGGAHQWLQVSFQLPIYGHQSVEISYRVTVRTAQ
jgi:hypothetical protein